MSKYRLVRKFRYGTSDKWYEVHKRMPIIGWIVLERFDGDHARIRALDYWTSIIVNGRIVKAHIEGEI